MKPSVLSGSDKKDRIPTNTVAPAGRLDPVRLAGSKPAVDALRLYLGERPSLPRGQQLTGRMTDRTGHPARSPDNPLAFESDNLDLFLLQHLVERYSQFGVLKLEKKVKKRGNVFTHGCREVDPVSLSS